MNILVNTSCYLKKWLFPHRILSPCHSWVVLHTRVPFTQDLKEHQGGYISWMVKSIKPRPRSQRDNWGNFLLIGIFD